MSAKKFSMKTSKFQRSLKKLKKLEQRKYVNRKQKQENTVSVAGFLMANKSCLKLTALKLEENQSDSSSARDGHQLFSF